MSPEFIQRLLAAELNPVKSRALLEGLGSRSVSDLLAWPGLTDRERFAARAADATALASALASGIRPVEPDEYPEQLAYADFPPPALFVEGDFACTHAPTIGIVGTRNASTYGRACAAKFAEAFARAGVTVVSGGALGIDAAAHKGALAAGGKTVAVLAGGIDKVYPAVHAGLFRQIANSGCLVSQFAVGARPEEYKFLIRNSLVALLSRALLVVEAPAKSGSLNTAQTAAELGREVFVVPASIDQGSFFGSFNLIRDGATLVDNPDQVLQALQVQPGLPMDVPPASSSVGARILEVLTVRPTPAERIVEKTGLDAAEVLAELTMLELDGQVIRDGGGYAKKP